MYTQTGSQFPKWEAFITSRLVELKGLPPKNRTSTSIRRITDFNFSRTLITSSSLLMQGENGSVASKAAGVSGSAATDSGGDGGRVLGTSSGGGGDEPPIVQFALTASSFLKIQKGDITKWFVDGASDAIVNAANERMLGGGGVDGAIHRAAGPELRAACFDVPEVRPGVRCPTGEARITPAFRLPVSHVIHTVGPIYDADERAEASLRSAYRNCLRLAKESNILFIGFPAISCGVYRYPYEEAAIIAISTVKEFAEDFKEVHFVLFLDELYNVWLEKAKELL